jgi:hypothetical protein
VRLDSPANGDHVGEPMLVYEFTVQDSDKTKAGAPAKVTRDYTGRKMFANAMCWEGALYTQVQILKAIGEYDNCLDSDGDLDINTEPEFYLGRQLMVRRALDSNQRKRWPDNEDYWIQCRGFFALPSGEGSAAAEAPKDAALLP